MAGLALFGGTFNPIHIGHLRIAEEIRELLAIEEVCFIPAKDPPLKPGIKLLPADLRLKLVKASIRGNPHFTMSTIEHQREGPSYTLITAQDIIKKRRLGTQRPYFIIGEAFKDIRLWWHYEKLLEIVNFVVVSRPGFMQDMTELNPFVESLGFWYNSDIEIPNHAKERRYEEEDSKSSVKPITAKSLSDSNAPKLSIPSNSDRTQPLSGGTNLPRMRSSFSHRSGAELFVVDVTPVHVSSTDIRTRLKDGRSIRYLMHEGALKLLQEKTTNYEI
jgi:nicotinate-nucleotide adenylyltransferase